MTPPAARGRHGPGRYLYHRAGPVTLYLGDAHDVLRRLPDQSVHCVVTSPPYYATRDYGVPGQLGQEPTPDAYVDRLCRVLDQVRRVLHRDGTMWLNLGDGYASTGGASGAMAATGLATRLNRLPRPEAVDPDKHGRWRRGWGLAPKQLLGLPWRVAFRLQSQGWWLRQAVIWHKPNAMPESVRDRPSSSHEYLFLLTRSPRYHFDLDPIRVPLAHPEKAGTPIGAADTPGHTAVGASARRRGSAYGPPKYTTDPAAHHGRGSRRNLLATGAAHTAAYPKGRNPGSVWTIPTRPSRLPHFSAFPIDLPLRCIAAGSPPGGVVLDPFAGTSTTGLAALQLGRSYVGIDHSPAYHDLAKSRLGLPGTG